MNELARLQYLDAMGITQYVARAPLPGARPSPLLNIAWPQPEKENPVDVLESVEVLRANVSPAQHTTIMSTPEKFTPENPAPEKPAPEKSAPQKNTDHSVFQCQIAIWSADDLLILADCTRMDNPLLTLLRNILAAIGRTTELSPAQSFNWPITQRKEKNHHAAREHFQGLLDAGPLKKSGLRQILVFGEQSLSLLGSDNPRASIANTSNSYHDWPVIATDSLQHLLETPASKRATWKSLQVLLRA